MMKFIDAANNGAEVRYLVTIDILGAEQMLNRDMDPGKMRGIVQGIFKMREAGLKFDVRIFPGVRTYSQVSLNNESTALVITENPLTATWLTREFNPDLIDNAVTSFDEHWESAISLFELTADGHKITNLCSIISGINELHHSVFSPFEEWSKPENGSSNEGAERP
ncbi:MAG: hypothetical protein ACW97O_13850 [Candidatus Thorarchaeota archaeon]|jgi:hypothetical protein